MNNNLDRQYLSLLKKILQTGTQKVDRTGTGTLSVFDCHLRLNMAEGFPLLTSKKMFTKAVIIELIWFLRGDTNIKYLVDHDCHIWNGDAYKNYLKGAQKIIDQYKAGDLMGIQPHIEGIFSDPDGLIPLSLEQFVAKIKTHSQFAKTWGELGPIYGHSWRNWNGNSQDPQAPGIDQISGLIAELKSNPDSRRLMVTAWNPTDLVDSVLPPCHFNFQCYTTPLNFTERLLWWTGSLGKDSSYGADLTTLDLDRLAVPTRKLSLKWSQRSCDFPLGVPFNVASYAFLLHLLAREVNMIPHELIFSGGDCHIYLNQIKGVRKQLEQGTYRLPTLELSNTSLKDLKYEDFKIIGYQSSDKISFPLSN